MRKTIFHEINDIHCYDRMYHIYSYNVFVLVDGSMGGLVDHG